MEYRDKLQQLEITADKSGKYTCPKCSATRKNKADKCLSVNFADDAVLYKCHNCNWSGSVFYRDKFEYKKQYKRPEMPKVKDDKQPLYDYFEKRGISKDVVNKLGVGINDKKEIIFPYYKGGELVNIKYRTNIGNGNDIVGESGEPYKDGVGKVDFCDQRESKNHFRGKKTFRQEADAEKTFFGMDLITDFKQLVVVEGEIDVLSFAVKGIEAVSVPQGASENKLECIDNCWDWLQKFDTYVIAVDNDSAGDKLKANLLSRLDKNKCKTVNFAQYKDANEVLCGGGDLQNIIANAEYIAPDGVVSFYDCIEEIYEFKVNGYTKGYSTGWASVDEKFTIKTSHLMIVTGYPSRGKSFFTDNLLFNLSQQYGLKHLIASFENTNANHFSRFAQMYTEKKFSEIPPEEFQDAYKFIGDHFYRLHIDRLWTVDEIIESCELAVRKYGIKTLTIDPYNRLNNNYTEREDKYVGSILAKLSMLAKKLDILVIFIAHPKKPDGEKLPTMYSISGSSDWYNMADYGLIIHRERLENGELENKPKIIAAKIKDFNLGDPSGGEVQLEYMPSRYKLIDAARYHGKY